MRLLLDISYLLIGAFIAPFWMIRKIRTGTLADAMRGRCGPWSLPECGGHDRILIHAVSVGEVNAVSRLADLLFEDGRDVVISVTTETGYSRAVSMSGGRFPVIRTPLDLSWIVKSYLDAVDPAIIVLVELEVWPNLMAACRGRDIPVMLVNGRVSDRSIRRYRWIKSVLHRAFRGVDRVLAQNEISARRFVELGVPRDRVMVAGNMKWDAPSETFNDDAVSAFAQELGIDLSRPVIVAGSTEPSEHRLLRDALPSDVQLIIAPRRPEWFNDAADVFEGASRRSRKEASSSDVMVLDSIGELSMAYAMADIVVIGRSFGALHGSDPMQAAVMGKAIIIGPAVADFADAVSILKAGGGILQIDAPALGPTLQRLVTDPAQRAAVGDAARVVSQSQRGATATCARMIADARGRAK